MVILNIIQHLPRPYMCRTLEGMRQALCEIGSLISQNGTPAVTGPFVIAVTGYVNNKYHMILDIDSYW